MTFLLKKNKFSNPRQFINPVGLINGVNLDYTIPSGEEFFPGTLEIYVDGNILSPLSFTESGTTGFSVIVDPSDPNARNKPFRPSETIWLSYFKKPKCA